MARPVSALCLSVLLLAAFVLPHADQAGAGEPHPPRGFVSLFNGKDLAGWHGMPHQDPYKLDKMEEGERQKKLAGWTADARKHWQARDGELINDGHGAYLTTDKEYGDIELLLE